MGRTRRNCPVFGCGSTNLARLANHLDQVHGMDTEERKKWLKWSKIGIYVPRQNEEPKEFSMEESVKTLLKRQEEMERKFNVYLQAAILKKVQSSKPNCCEKVPLLPANKKRNAVKVLDVKSVEHKGVKRKLLLAEDGTVYKVKRSRMENNVEAGQYV